MGNKPKPTKTVKINGMEKIPYRGNYVGVRKHNGRYYPIIFMGKHPLPALIANERNNQRSDAYGAAVRGRDLIDTAIRMEAARREIPVPEQQRLEEISRRQWVETINKKAVKNDESI